MTRDELYPIIYEVLSERTYPYKDTGSAWISGLSSGDISCASTNWPMPSSPGWREARREQ